MPDNKYLTKIAQFSFGMARKNFFKPRKPAIGGTATALKQEARPEAGPVVQKSESKMSLWNVYQRQNAGKMKIDE